MANFDSLVIDRVLEIVGENSDGELLYLLNNLSNVSINTTGKRDISGKPESLYIPQCFY